MDYVDSAVSSGGRFLKDVYKDVLSPAGRNLEKVTSEDVIDPAVRKLKNIVGPRWNEVSRFGRKAKNYVIKGLTGLDRLGSDAYNTARRLYNSSGAIGDDLSRAYSGVRGDLGSFAARYKNNSRNTLEAARNVLDRHMSNSAENFSELSSDLQGTLGDMWGSIGNRASGLQKSSSLQKDANFFYRWLASRAARRTIANARKILPTARATRTRSYNKAAEEYYRKMHPGTTVNPTPTPEGIPTMSYKGPVNANFNGTPNPTMTTPPPTAAPAAATAGAATEAASAAVPGHIINNNIQLAGGIPAGMAGAVPAGMVGGAVPAATSSLGSKLGTGMNVLTMGMMGYGMLGDGGAAAAQAPAAGAAMAAANPGMYMPQTNYVNWAANNNILRGLYM